MIVEKFVQMLPDGRLGRKHWLDVGGIGSEERGYAYQECFLFF
jgi:hypothetical protein